jgi:type IV pilus assembly protein PilM
MKLFSDLKGRFVKGNFSLGLDIGTHSVKVVKLRFVKDQVELCGFDLIPAHADSVDILRGIKETQKIDVVNIGFCGPSTIIRCVDFPRMTEIELKQALKFEAQKHISFRVSEINLDAYILKKDLADNKMLVLLAGIKKDLVNQRMKLIEGLGFKIKVIDLDSIALFNVFKFNYLEEVALAKGGQTLPYRQAGTALRSGDFLGKDKTIALLNIGASTSNLDIVENGILSLSRDIYIAGNNWTQKLEDVLVLDHSAAVFESALNDLAKEIRISFDYFESQSTSSVSKIFLSGGSAKIPGLKDMLSNFLGIEVDYWDPFKNIGLSSAIDSEELKEKSCRLAVACGLALRG